MKKLAYLFSLLLAIFYFSLAPSTNIKEEKAKVITVIDGDTLIVKNNNRDVHVRLIGIDAPEMHDNEKAQRDSQRSGIDIETIIALGKQSQKHLQQLIHKGSEVKLVSDVSKFDKYGRTLAYVYLPNGDFINQKMIEDGYAYPFRVPPNIKFERNFRDAAKIAREKSIGLWSQKKR